MAIWIKAFKNEKFAICLLFLIPSYKEIAAIYKDPKIKKLALAMISNRKVLIWLEEHEETFCVDEWRCRFLNEKARCTQKDIIELLAPFTEKGAEVIRIECLYSFDGKPLFSGVQG